MAVWDLAGRARNDFATMIESLSEEQLEQQSLCEQWTARGVLCHLTSFVETGGFAFMTGLVKSGFNFDKASVVMAQKQLDRPVADVLRALRSKATQSAPFPGFPEAMTSTDIAIHTQDVRRPLAVGGALDPELLSSSLEFLTTAKQATQLVNRRPIESVTLRATDMDWTFGSGPEIAGTGEALMMGMANRPVLDDLAGEGLSAWQ